MIVGPTPAFNSCVTHGCSDRPSGLSVVLHWQMDRTLTFSQVHLEMLFKNGVYLFEKLMVGPVVADGVKKGMLVIGCGTLPGHELASSLVFAGKQLEDGRPHTLRSQHPEREHLAFFLRLRAVTHSM